MIQSVAGVMMVLVQGWETVCLVEILDLMHPIMHVPLITGSLHAVQVRNLLCYMYTFFHIALCVECNSK